MNVTFYKCASEKNALNKILESDMELEGSVRGQSDVIKPQIMIGINPIGYDYVYIKEWNRYYFINDIICYRANAFIVKLEIDVLMTYKEEIKNMKGVVSRLTDANPYGERDLLTSVKENLREFIFVDSPFTTDGDYILIAQGGNF